jgi:hypothetical protein
VNLLRVRAPGCRTTHLAYELADGRPGSVALCFAFCYGGREWIRVEAKADCPECKKRAREKGERHG